MDIRYALRMLRRNPAFAAVAVLSLALGIGANTAIFSLIDAILLKSLPVREPERLVVLQEVRGKMVSTGFPYSAYKLFQSGASGFVGLMAYAPVRLNVSLGGPPEPYASGQLVTGSYFSLLGVNAAVGRTISDEDNRVQGGHPVVMISYQFWKRRFALDPKVLEKSVAISGRRFSIIGVTPPGFFGTEVGSAPDFYVPLMMQVEVMPGMADWIKEDRQTGPWLHIVGRLKPGTSEAQALASLQPPWREVEARFLALFTSKFRGQSIASARLELIPGERGLSELRRRFSRPLEVLMGIVALVLLIACANVANLLLARTASRRKEIALRLALGAGRLRLVRQLLTESVLLSVAGGAAGLLFAWWATRALIAFLPRSESNIALHLSPDARMLGFTLAVSLLTGVLFGLAPALRSASLHLSPSLKQSARPAGGQGFRYSLGKALVAVQIALSLVLVAGATLFVRSLENLRRVDTGFTRDRLLSLRLEPLGSEFKTARLDRDYQDLLQRIRAIPGVRAASLAGFAPISRNAWEHGQSYDGGLRMSALGDPSTANGVEVRWMQVYPGYFATMGIPLLAGRDLAPRDTRESQPVAVINETMALMLFAGRNPIGRRFGVTGQELDIEVAGVVRDARYGNLRDAPAPMYFQTFQQMRTGRGQMTLHVRVSGNAAPVAAAVRREAQALCKDVPLFELTTLEEQVDAALTRERLIAMLSGFFGTLALVLACIGLYGTMTYMVSRRTAEIGIRMALGARRETVVWLVLREGMMLALAGLAVGLPAAFAASRMLAGMIFGLSSAAPWWIALAFAPLAAAAALAALMPAARAARVDPMVALRYE